MKKYLLPETGNFYKANLHCHSTVSDGKLSPAELKKIYMEKGYSIIAYTDHNVLLSHADLADENFLPLNGFEIDITEEKEWSTRSVKTCHICLVALDPDNLTMPCYHRTKYLNPKNSGTHRDEIVFDESLPDFERVYNPECINTVIKTGRENGFFVTYNHPVWSLEEKEQYCNYHGMHAMEICNYGCVAAGYGDYNEKQYDEMIRGGEKIFCIATDDNHNFASPESRHFDSFGGFTVIKAEKLEYKTITNALVAGSFYASQAPEIHSLWFEDGKIHIECSDADRVILTTGKRRTGIVYAENGVPVTSASFEVLPDDDYVRLTVTDSRGYHANTNAYFTDELFK